MSITQHMTHNTIGLALEQHSSDMVANCRSASDTLWQSLGCCGCFALLLLDNACSSAHIGCPCHHQQNTTDMQLAVDLALSVLLEYFFAIVPKHCHTG